MTPKWKPKKESYTEALKYLVGRRKGEITSLRTPWERVDDAGICGIEWGSAFVIAARSGNFKTTMKDQIVKNAFKLNPDTNIRIMDWQLDMSGRVTAIREFSSTLGKPYKYLCSAEKENGQNLILSKEDYMKCFEYAKAKAEDPRVDVVHEPCTVQEFEAQVRLYLETHKNEETGEYPHVLIAVDHTRQFIRAPYESEEEMIFNFSQAIIRLKNDSKYKLIFIILSQLNRNYEVAARHEDGKYSNYITSADIFGSDSIYQCCDILLAINRPGIYGMKLYGPNRFVVDSDRLMCGHFLKVRNGDPRISFFEAHGERMEVEEREAPSSALRKLPTMTPMEAKKKEEAVIRPMEPNTLFTEESQIYTNQTPNF